VVWSPASQGCSRIEDREARCAVSTFRHCLTRSWHSGDTRYLNLRSATQICSSDSNGMSPHTMSKRRSKSAWRT
jgi:hypothetical protein